MTIKIRLTMSILYILISVGQWGKKEFLAIRFEGHKQVPTKIKVNSFGAITYFRERLPPIRAQIHTKKIEQKNARRRQQKTVTMTIKDI